MTAVDRAWQACLAVLLESGCLLAYGPENTLDVVEWSRRQARRAGSWWRPKLSGVNALDREGQNTLMFAVEIPDLECVGILLRAGARLDAAVVELLRSGASAKSVDAAGRKAAHHAAEHGRYMALEALLSSDVDWAARDFKGFSALDLAKRKGPRCQSMVMHGIEWQMLDSVSAKGYKAKSRSI